MDSLPQQYNATTRYLISAHCQGLMSRIIVPMDFKWPGNNKIIDEIFYCTRKILSLPTQSFKINVSCLNKEQNFTAFIHSLLIDL
jgi:hypothetical protein